MGATIAEKILGSHAGSGPAKAGDVIVASVGFAMLHDAREVPPLPVAVQEILAAGGLIPFLKAHPNWRVA